MNRVFIHKNILHNQLINIYHSIHELQKFNTGFVYFTKEIEERDVKDTKKKNVETQITVHDEIMFLFFVDFFTIIIMNCCFNSIFSEH